MIRVKVPGSVKLMPHKHPEDRLYTVISGVFYIGRGDQFDPGKLEAYLGAVIVLPGNTPHFHRAKSGECVTQVTAIGATCHGIPRLERRSAKQRVPLSKFQRRRGCCQGAGFEGRTSYLAARVSLGDRNGHHVRLQATTIRASRFSTSAAFSGRPCKRQVYANCDALTHCIWLSPD